MCIRDRSYPRSTPFLLSTRSSFITIINLNSKRISELKRTIALAKQHQFQNVNEERKRIKCIEKRKTQWLGHVFISNWIYSEDFLKENWWEDRKSSGKNEIFGLCADDD